MRFHRKIVKFAVTAILLTNVLTNVAKADDGYRLWLRYEKLPAELIKTYEQQVMNLAVPGTLPILDAVREEMVSGCTGMLGRNIPVSSVVEFNSAILLGTPQSSTFIAALNLQLNHDGFIVRSVKVKSGLITVIASNSERSLELSDEIRPHLLG